MLKVEEVKEIHEMKGAGRSVRGIAQELDVSRNTVRRRLKFPEAMRPKPRPLRGSKLDPYTEHTDRRMAEGLENCRVLDREVRALGYQGGYSTVVQYVRPRRRHKQPEAAMRFETAPGEQAQVDWGSLPHIGEDGKRRRVRVFVLTLGWSRACCVEMARRCLYDNAKVITLGRDEEKRPVWDRRMLDFALRAGFEAGLCQPYRAQTKGKVENGVKYVRRNMWPGMRFTDDADLNRQGLEWSGVAANARVHGTTYRIPWEMPDRVTPAPYLRKDRKVARDGLVSWEDSRYGVHWQWVGRTVQVGQRLGTVEIRSGDERIAVHPPAQRAGQRFILPGSPASGKARPGGMAGPAGRRWRCRSPPVRWSAAPWTCTNWLPWEAPDDHAGTGSQAPGDPGTEAGRRDPGHRRQQRADLP